MRKHVKTVYVSNDGNNFESEKECLAYEKQQEEKENNTSYWRVMYKPDLTEGRGYYGLAHLSVEYSGYVNHEILVKDYCFRTLGRILSFVQGVAEMEGWIIKRITKEKFLKDDYTSVGDYKYKAERIYLAMGNRDEGLIIKEV